MQLFLAACASLLLLPGPGLLSTCVERSYGSGRRVCVCDSRQCGALFDGTNSTAPGTFTMYTTSRAGLRLRRESANFTNGYIRGRRGRIWSYGNRASFIVGSTCYQTLHGFGGALTDSAAINILSLSEATRSNLMSALFGSNGNAYTLLRMPMGGTDDSMRKYTYADIPGGAGQDPLQNFQLADEDIRFKIPIVRNASTLADGRLRLVGSAWTAPPWMKSNGQFVSGVLRKEYYQAWADYHIKFLEEYAALGLPVWAITSGNEPINGFAPWIIRFNSMGWTPWSQRLWIGRHLGPALRRSKHNATLLLALDDQRMLLPWWLDVMLLGSEADKYVDGVAVHWYWDIVDPSVGLEATHDHFPNKFILSSEASSADKPWDREKVRLGSWSRAEKYMADIITDLSHWVTGWMEWSLVLDLQGGPSWSGNLVDVSVIADPAKDQFLLQPTYFAVAHFSRFVPPGSQRIRLEQVADKEGEPFANVRAVAFRTPQKIIAIVVQNMGDSDVSLTLQDPEVGTASVVLTARSFSTILYSQEGHS